MRLNTSDEGAVVGERVQGRQSATLKKELLMRRQMDSSYGFAHNLAGASAVPTTS